MAFGTAIKFVRQANNLSTPITRLISLGSTPS